MFERYKRQTILPEVAIKGQQILKQSRILVAGAGGLASSALQFLVGAGCGNITIFPDSLSATHPGRSAAH